MLLQLDFSSDIPIYLQLRNQIVVGIADGSLKPGEKLPTIRALGDEFGINMMTVNKAYQLLKQEGYIVTDRRAGAMVQGTPTAGLPEEAEERLRLLISEAKIHGVGREEFFARCHTLFDEMEGEKP